MTPELGLAIYGIGWVVAFGTFLSLVPKAENWGTVKKVGLCILGATMWPLLALIAVMGGA